MRKYIPKEEDLEIPDLNTDLEIRSVNPLFLLIENFVDVIYFLQVLSQNIDLASFLMEIYKNFLESFESKIDILNEEIQAGDYSIKNFHLIDCKHLIRNLKEISANNFTSDYQFLLNFLVKAVIEGKVKNLILDDLDVINYPNFFDLANSFSKNTIFEKDYNMER
jgi:hypothetical protein